MRESDEGINMKRCFEHDGPYQASCKHLTNNKLLINDTCTNANDTWKEAQLNNQNKIESKSYYFSHRMYRFKFVLCLHSYKWLLDFSF